MMKRILTVALLLSFATAIVGCEAQAKVGDPNNSSMDNGSSYEKKTTKVTDPNGDTHTKTEVHSNN